MAEKALVYMVAGLSSRFKGKIKAFVKVGPNNESLMEYSLNQAIPVGFTKIIFIVGKQTETAFKEKFGNNYKGIPIQYALQDYDEETRDKPWGTCDALLSAKEYLDCPFVVCAGDDIYGEQTFKILFKSIGDGEESTIGKKLHEMLPKEGTVNRGIFYIDKENNVKEIREIEKINHKNLEEKNLKENDMTSISIFALQTNTLNMLSEKLQEFKQENKESRTAECYLNVKLGELIKEGKVKIKLYETPEKWFGVTNPGDEIQIQKTIQQ